jgi:TPR repeat protein
MQKSSSNAIISQSLAKQTMEEKLITAHAVRSDQVLGQDPDNALEVYLTIIEECRTTENKQVLVGALMSAAEIYHNKPKGDVMALFYYRQAADLGNLTASYNVGVIIGQKNKITSEEEKEMITRLKAVADKDKSYYTNIGLYLDACNALSHYYYIKCDAIINPKQTNVNWSILKYLESQSYYHAFSNYTAKTSDALVINSSIFRQLGDRTKNLANCKYFDKCLCQ